MRCVFAVVDFIPGKEVFKAFKTNGFKAAGLEYMQDLLGISTKSMVKGGSQVDELIAISDDLSEQVLKGVDPYGKQLDNLADSTVISGVKNLDEGVEASKQFTLNGDVSPSTSNLDNLSGKLDDGFGLKGNIPDKPIANAGQPLDGLEGPTKTFDLNAPGDDILKVKDVSPPPPVPPKREVPYGEHIVRGKRGRKELLPNIKYVTDSGYVYTTDSLGRSDSVKVSDLVLGDGGRNNGMQAVAGREYRLPDDQGGHLIAPMFNGPKDLDNLVAMNKEINTTGSWAKMEKSWRDALTEVPPRKVSIQIEPIYIGDSLRPDKFSVIYQIGGKDIIDTIIKNQAGG